MRAAQWSTPFFVLVKNGVTPDYRMRQLALLCVSLQVVKAEPQVGRPERI